MVGLGIRVGVGAQQRRSVGPVVFDDFNRADNSTTIGNALTGQPWDVTGGVYGIRSGRMYLATNTLIEPLAVVESGLSDCVVSAEFYGGPGYSGSNPAAGIHFRVSDHNNVFRFYPDSNHFRVARTEGGQVFVMGNNNTLSPANGQILSVVLNGENVKCYAAGTLLFDFNHAFNRSATKHGVYVRDQSRVAQWDNFRVEALPS